MNVNNLNQLEDRIEKPGYLLFLVTVLLFLIIGLVNLIDYNSPETAVFNRYSLPYFGLIVIYTLGVVAWAALLRRPNDDSLLQRTLDFVQQRPVIALAILAAYGGVVWSLLNTAEWLNFPAMQATVIVLMLLSSSLILFYRWGDETRPQLWRKFVVIPLAVILGIEMIVQLLTFAGILPNVTQLTDSFSPFERIYYTDEGYRNGMANSDGWNYPEFRLYPDSYRILLFGDSFIQALQVAPEENLGIVLQGLLNQDLPAGEIIEVLALGNPDYGPGLYLNPPMIDFAIDAYEPDEVIAFFDLGNDFQTITGPDDVEIYFIINEEGTVEVHEDNFWLRHRYQHEVLHAYEGFQPNRFFRSHYFTPQVIQYFLGGEQVAAASAASVTTPAGDLDLPNAFVFNADTNDEAMAIATGHIEKAHAHLAEQGIPLSLVTIPVFADAFFAQDEWNMQFGEADLLLPERELRAFAQANDIPFLGLGAYMAVEETTPTAVQEWYFSNGRGYFTPAGHDMVATTVYNCFFAQTLAAEAGCDAR